MTVPQPQPFCCWPPPQSPGHTLQPAPALIPSSDAPIGPRPSLLLMTQLEGAKEEEEIGGPREEEGPNGGEEGEEEKQASEELGHYNVSLGLAGKGGWGQSIHWL